jgi:hypothetical protein
MLYMPGTRRERAAVRQTTAQLRGLVSIYADPNDRDPTASSPPAVQKVRLMQIVTAVKDKQAKETGWISEALMYDGGPSGQPASCWFNVSPDRGHVGQ